MFFGIQSQVHGSHPPYHGYMRWLGDGSGAQMNAQLAARWPCRRPLQAPRRSNQQRQVNLQLACRVREPHCPALRHQPSQRRMLRKHGMRTRGSELVKVCGEVVKSALLLVDLNIHIDIIVYIVFIVILIILKLNQLIFWLNFSSFRRL